MSWELVWTRPAVKDVENLDPPVAERVLKAADRFADTEHGDVKKLKGKENRYRLRVGDWRVIFRFLKDRNAIAVLRVRPRGSAYR